MDKKQYKENRTFNEKGGGNMVERVNSFRKVQMKNIVNIYHMNNSTNQWKAVDIVETPDGRVLLTMRQGVAGQKDTVQSITIQLSENEIALIAVKLLGLMMR